MAYNKVKKDGTPARKPGRKPLPKVEKPKKRRGGPRPHVWLCGPDEFKHSMYMPWMRSKAQAHFRKEEWDLSFDEYYEIWKELWNQRGRGADDYCQSRIDPNGPWNKRNMIIITRKEHLIQQRENRKLGIFKRGTSSPGRKKKVKK